MNFSLRATVLGLGLLAASVASAATSYSMSVFTVAGASSSDLYDINNLGQMVGNTTIDGVRHGFYVSGGSTSLLSGPAGAVAVNALGLSDTGLVVGGFFNDGGVDENGNRRLGPSQAYLFDGSSYTVLAAPGASETVARAISPDGRYVSGYAIDAAGGFSGWLLDRNDGSYTTIASGLMVIAQGVTNDGRVVGSRVWQDPAGTPPHRYSFSYQGGVLEHFNLDGQIDSRARALNDDGLLAGFLREGSTMRGFIGSTSDYAVLSWAGAEGTFIEGLNNAGWAVGAYLNADGNFQALVFQPVPEPASAALLIGGLGLVGAAARRKKAA